MKKFILFVFVSLIAASALSQNQQYVGISLNPEFKDFNSLVLSYGVTYENQLSKHSGFEIDLIYRSSVNYFVYNAPASGIFNVNEKIRESFISLPLLYKYYNDFVNISVGLSLNSFVGWKDLSENQNMQVTYNVNPKFFAGWIAKVSKPFALSQKLVLEPEIYINPDIGYGHSYFGVSAKLKYKL